MAGRSFALREQVMLRRVAVGLMQEGVTTAIATPRSIGEPDHAGLTTLVTYDDLGWSLTTHSRSRMLLQSLTSEEHAGWGGSDAPIDVVHAWGHAAWPMAMTVARESSAAVVLDVWSVQAAEQIRRSERSASKGREEAIRGAWLAPSRSLLRHAEARAQLWACHLVHWGVHAPEKLPEQESHSDRGIAVVCSGDLPDATIAMLEGLAAIIPQHPHILVFLDEAAVKKDHEVWRAAQRLGLLDRLSVIADMETRRELILQADLLLLPDIVGEARSVILDAMGEGVVVISDGAAASDALIDGRTALLINERRPEHWAQAIASVLSDDDTRNSIRREAHRMVMTERRVHSHVASLLRVYGELSSPEPIEFRPDPEPHSSR